MTDTLVLELTETSDDDLHARTLSVARKEQQTTLELLVHIQEIDRRKLFASLGYGSLWEYTVTALHYSESQAAERIAAMRLLVRTEEARRALEEGSLTLTQAALTERHLRAEEKESKAPVRSEEVVRLLSEVSGRSRRETEKVLLSYRPREERAERIQAVTQELSEIRFSVSEATRGMIERCWELQGRGSLSDLFTRCLSFYLEAKDPLQKRGSKREGKNSGNHKISGNSFPPPSTPPAELSAAQTEMKEAGAIVPEMNSSDQKPSRYVAAKVRREVWKRSKGECEYVDPDSQRRCRSRYRPEVDHIHPHALGGTSAAENLRLLCRTHNQYLGEWLFSKESDLFATLSRG